MIYYKNLKMLGCLLLALPFAYLINCTSVVANTAVALVPCHTAYFLPTLLCINAGLLSLTTRPTARVGLYDLVILFSLFLSVPAHRSAHLKLFIFSFPLLFFYLILCGVALNYLVTVIEVSNLQIFLHKAGPEVSLNGSPTVSPTTATL